jgi:hypothetical protein
METSKKADEFDPSAQRHPGTHNTRAGDRAKERASGGPGPVKRPQHMPEHGAPATCAAHAMRKDVSVRVSVTPPTPEPEELREHGYGHGV